jgi:hypothetical protein
MAGRPGIRSAGAPDEQNRHRRVIHDEASHMTDASGPGLGLARPGAGAQDHGVYLQPSGSGDDFLLRAAGRGQVCDFGARQDCRESLVPYGQ